MQNNIDIVGRNIRRNMLQPKSQSSSDKIDNQRPFRIAVAISANNRDRRPDPAQLIHNDLRSNIAKMPDLAVAARKLANLLGQLAMSFRAITYPALTDVADRFHA